MQCPDEPYDRLPPLPPAADFDPPELLRSALAATRALHRLDLAVQTLAEPLLLLDAVPLLEAQSSSDLEHIVTTGDDLFRGAADGGAVRDPAVREVLRYRGALRQAVGKPFSVLDAECICSAVRAVPVRFRAAGETVFLTNPLTGDRVYAPPTGRCVRPLLEDLDRYLRTDPTDPLIKLAVGHYQFEAIHPFADGNGRTGRILSLLYLLDQGYLRDPVLYLSGWFLDRRRDYYRRLRHVTERQDWESWVAFVLEGLTVTADRTAAVAAAAARLYARTGAACRGLPCCSEALLRTVFARPYCKTALLVEAGLARRQTAAQYLKELAAAGVLTAEKRGRTVYYRNDALIAVLEAGTRPAAALPTAGIWAPD